MNRVSQPLSVTSCWIYPIKSCAGVSVGQIDIRKRGPVGDREWMLIDESGQFLTQRTLPQLSLIQPRLTDDAIELTADSFSPYKVSRKTKGQERTAQIWGDQVLVEEPDPVASEWFSEFLKQSVHLVKIGDRYSRPLAEKWKIEDGENSLSDGFPLLLANETSLESLNSELETPISMKHFRPNITVRSPLSFEEEDWLELQSSDSTFVMTKPCTRCVMICNNPEEGIRTSKNILHKLGELHRFENKITFGINLVPLKDSPLKVGDTLKVIAIRQQR
ncbi:MAG: MOSC N-terminal beta barrel domain-containing protein [Bdellovibrionales bacterium]|nr:MOSC N-terminal beta barrel domain-containing protein [Bdellovibrionales bacterium]